MERAHPDHTIISSNRVQDTKVFSLAGEHIGDVDHLMIDKQSGQVEYVVVSFGGFLGLGHNHYPLPWPALTYSTELGGYATGVTEDQLRDSPKFSDDELPDRAWEAQMYSHYSVVPYW